MNILMMETRPANTIARERVEDLASRGEPEWMKASRFAAWETYFQSPMPSERDEQWRKTSLALLDIPNLITLDFPAAGEKEQPLPSLMKSALELITERSGFLSQSTQSPGYISISETAKKQGVIFCDFRSAIEKHAELIRPYITGEISGAREQSITKIVEGKFGSLNKALLNCGLFLYVPKNVEINEPFISGLNFACGDHGAIFPRIIVVAEPNSKVNLIQILESDSPEGKPNCLANGVVEVHAGQNARVNYLEVQQFGHEVFSIWGNRNEVARDAQFTSLTAALGGNQTKCDIITRLLEPGAHSEVLGVVLGSVREHYNFNTVQEHASPDTSSDINFRVALKDSSSSIYQGVIKIDKVAQRTVAYQSNKNLLLGSEAKADSIPKLEILADDVKCSHGATVGPVDQEQVFYLMSRGLAREQAEELIVLGFFRQVLEQFPLVPAVQWLGSKISEIIYPQGSFNE
jgi:Fe-S cluster assembly protein SufD